MAMYLCEFEFVADDDGAVLCWPFWPGRVDGTFGVNFDDAMDMAADWLRIIVLDYLARGREIPTLPRGSKPMRGGQIIAIAVEASLSDVPAMTATEAAGLLGVSQGRVTQLCKAGKLDSWKVGGTRMVSRESVEMRLAQERRAGRPRRELATA